MFTNLCRAESWKNQVLELAGILLLQVLQSPEHQWRFPLPCVWYMVIGHMIAALLGSVEELRSTSRQLGHQMLKTVKQLKDHCHSEFNHFFFLFVSVDFSSVIMHICIYKHWQRTILNSDIDIHRNMSFQAVTNTLIFLLNCIEWRHDQLKMAKPKRISIRNDQRLLETYLNVVFNRAEFIQVMINFYGLFCTVMRGIKHWSLEWWSTKNAELGSRVIFFFSV